MSGAEPGKLDSELEQRLDRIEGRISQSQASRGGVGCLGLALFGYTIYLLHQILDKLGG